MEIISGSLKHDVTFSGSETEIKSNTAEVKNNGEAK